jgi:hypothetical protein
MTALPAAGYFTNPARTNSQAKSAQDDTLAFLRQSLGMSARSATTLVSDDITPTNAQFSVDTQSGAGTDDLRHIIQTHLEDGKIAVVKSANVLRTVVAKHGVGGAGQLLLADGADLSLTDPSMRLILERVGTSWEEVGRFWGNNKSGLRSWLGLTDTALISLAALRGWISGLTMSNAADTVNDITVAAGAAMADDQSAMMVLGSAITKQLDANWAVGNNLGGRDSTAAIANDVYHVFLIQRPDTGVVDVFMSHLIAPTLPPNYTRKRRIGSIIRAGATILQFSQVGDEFLLKTGVLDVNAAAISTTALTPVLSVPDGIKVGAIFNFTIVSSAAANILLLSPIDVNDQAPSGSVAPLAQAHGTTSYTNYGYVYGLRTSTSATIRARSQAANGLYSIATLGWVDARGRTD